jgi:hypothetical protein
VIGPDDRLAGVDWERFDVTPKPDPLAELRKLSRMPVGLNAPLEPRDAKQAAAAGLGE